MTGGNESAVRVIQVAKLKDGKCKKKKRQVSELKGHNCDVSHILKR